MDLMDLMPAGARIFGGRALEDYVDRCPELSLLDQGVLDMPCCCPLLLVNGKDDQQNTSADLCLALEHGAPRRPGVPRRSHGRGARAAHRSRLADRTTELTSAA
ncbi:hypothetical protein [Streptomyces roseifaciens]|uniref:hypothetical protein n=1 Tax=Streptomyces roseifaciens TaxID=1488406 RepID=UPI000717EFDB|nr:hypothetical protein [Streptomyces roseifaciens]